MLLLLLRGVAAATTTSATATLDAIVRVNVSSTSTADAILQQTLSSSWAADSILRGTISGSFAADAIARREIASQLTLDAIARVERSNQLALDSIMLAHIAGQISADAIKRVQQSGELVADAITLAIQQAELTVNAIAMAQQSGQFDVDAISRVIQQATLAADAAILGTQLNDSTIDAVVQATLSLTASVDAIKLAIQESALSADATILATLAGSGSIDSILQANVVSQVSVDAIKLAVTAGSLTADGIVQAMQSSFVDINAIVLSAIFAETTIDAITRSEIAGQLLVDAITQTTRDDVLSIDSIIQRWNEGSWYVDAIMRRSVEQYASLDAIVLAPFYGQLTGDAVLSATIVDQTTADAILLKQQQSSVGLDAITLRIVADQTSLDASFLATMLAQFSIDSVALSSIMRSWTIDGAVVYTATGTFTADGRLRKINNASFALNARIYSEFSSRFELLVDGDNVINSTIITDASFHTMTNGTPGTCSFRVRDLRDGQYNTQSFVTGTEIILKVDGDRMWGGYVTKVSYQYAFPADDTTNVSSQERFWHIEGADYNILFSRRYVWNQDEPTRRLRNFAKNTTDKAVIEHILDYWVDLSGDGINDSGVTHVGTPGYFSMFRPAVTGDSLGVVFNRLAMNTGALFYIDPDKVLRYVDDNVVTASHGLSDRPTGTQIGYRDCTIVSSGTELANDVLVWGAGLGRPRMVFDRAQSSASINKHGRFQYAEMRTDNYKKESVQRRSQTYLNGSPMNRRGHKNDHDFIKCTVFEPSYRVAQVVAFESETHEYSDNLPIRNMTITFPTPESIKMDLELSHEIDPGHTIADPYPYDDNFPRNNGGDGPTDPWWTYRDVTETIDLNNGETVSCAWKYQVTHDSVSSIPFVTYLPLSPEVGSYIYQNTSWPTANCVNVYGMGIGSGRWGPNAKSKELWYQLGPNAQRTENTDTRDVVIEIPPLTVKGHVTGFRVHHSTLAIDPLVVQPLPGLLIPGLTADESYEHSPVYYEDGSEVVIDVEPTDPDGIATERQTEPTVIRIPYEHRSPSGNWIVLIPQWSCGQSSFCDIGYPFPMHPYQGQGPVVTGQEYSGTSYWPYNLEAKLVVVPQENDWDLWPIDGVQNGAQLDDADGALWVSQTPYVPGTLEITIDGVHLREGVDFWEVEPSEGTFRLATYGDLRLTSNVTLHYQSNRIYWSSDFPDAYRPDFKGAGGTQSFNSLGPPSSYSGNGVYRPRFVSQLGWGYADDGINCVLAASCMALDRHTLGTVADTPHLMRAFLADWNGGVTLSQVDALFAGKYHLDAYYPGLITFAQFEKLINQGRGAVCHGNSTAFVPWNKHARSEYTGQPFTGPHAVYINEQRSDGMFYVMDPAFRPNSRYHISPGWYPREAVAAYLSYPDDVPAGYARALFTRKTPKR